MKQLAGHLVLIVGLSAVVLFTNLGAARLWDRDEPRNAGCAREMLQRNDWVTPMFNDRLRDAKPVLLYWLIMSAYAVFGDNEFAARFWSATLGVGTVLATYAIGRRLFNAQVALWGAIALATSMMFCVAGRAATPDSVLMFCGTTALMIFVLGTFKRRDANVQDIGPAQLKVVGKFFPQSWMTVAAMFGVMGLGVLAKGPVGLVLPTAIIGMFLLIMRLPQAGHGLEKGDSNARPSRSEGQVNRLEFAKIAVFLLAGVTIVTLWGLIGLVVVIASAELILRMTGRGSLAGLLRPFAPRHFLKTCWTMRPLTAVAIVLAVAGPWYIWVGVRTAGDFLRGFFLNEHFGRATSAMENHDGPLWYYVPAILVGFFPWSVFAVPVLIDVVRRIRERDSLLDGYVFLACWVGVYVGLFGLAGTKLPSYVTPCYPALALLAGGFIFHWTRGTQRAGSIWPGMALATLALVGVAISIGVPIAAHELLPGAELLGLIGLAPLLGAVVTLFFVFRQQRRIAGAVFGVSAVVLVTSIFGFATVFVDCYQKSHVLFRTIAQHSSSPEIASFGCLESSWVYYANRPIRELRLGPKHKSKQNHGQLTSHNKPRRAKPAMDVASFFSCHQQAFLITTRRRLEQLKTRLPPDVHVLTESAYFLKDETLVLLGRRQTRERLADQPIAGRQLR